MMSSWFVHSGFIPFPSAACLLLLCTTQRLVGLRWPASARACQPDLGEYGNRGSLAARNTQIEALCPRMAPKTLSKKYSLHITLLKPKKGKIQKCPKGPPSIRSLALSGPDNAVGHRSLSRPGQAALARGLQRYLYMCMCICIYIHICKLHTPPKTPNSQRHVKETVATTEKRGDEGRQREARSTATRQSHPHEGRQRETKGDKGRQRETKVLRMSANLK